MVSEREHYNRLTGDMGERAVYAIVEGLGYMPQWGGRGDLQIGRVDVEVKTSHLTCYRKDGRLGYQFCLRRDGHCAVGAHVVVLVCVGDEGTDYFVIPGHEVGNRRKIAIPNRVPRCYRGIWSRYLDAWHILETEIEKWRLGAPVPLAVSE